MVGGVTRRSGYIDGHVPSGSPRTGILAQSPIWRGFPSVSLGKNSRGMNIRARRNRRLVNLRALAVLFLRFWVFPSREGPKLASCHTGHRALLTCFVRQRKASLREAWRRRTTRAYSQDVSLGYGRVHLLGNVPGTQFSWQ